MKEHPILFSTSMVQAILRGEKTQTRRILKDGLPIGTRWHQVYDGELIYRIVDSKTVLTHCKCPYGKVGDQLWVRESFGKDSFGTIYYKADDLYVPVGLKAKWKPSIHMPKRASRIQLEIINLKVEQLQDITEEDAFAEGILIDATEREGKVYPLIRLTGKYLPMSYGDPTKAKSYYAALWDSLNEKRGFGWNKNPFVWTLEFRRIK